MRPLRLRCDAASALRGRPWLICVPGAGFLAVSAFDGTLHGMQSTARRNQRLTRFSERLSTARGLVIVHRLVVAPPPVMRSCPGLALCRRRLATGRFPRNLWCYSVMCWSGS